MYLCEGYGSQAKEARLILGSGIYIFVTNISEGTAFLFQGLNTNERNKKSLGLE